MPTFPSKTKGILLTLMATLCWGGGMVLSKKSLLQVHANSLFLIQLIAAWSAMAMVAAWQRKLSFKELAFGWLGVIEPGIAFYLVLLGLQDTTAINATILQSTEGMMIIGLSFILFRLTTPMRTLIWGGISTIGAVLVSVKNISNTAIHLNSGDAWVLLGTVFAALYVTLSARLIRTPTSAASYLFWQLSMCTLAIWMYQSFTVGVAISPDDVTIYSTGSGILAYGLSFYFYLMGLRHIPTSLAAVLLCFTPIFGVLLSMLFLSESMSLQSALGFAMILTATFFISLQPTTQVSQVT